MNNMLKLSFYSRTSHRDQLKKFIVNTEKPIVYTYGFEYRHPTTHRKPVDKEQALSIVRTQYYLDATEEDDCLHLNAYSDNDMF